ncbi:putative bifunctional diguanylate cyclase/phosphodiesterase [Pengzhenrongella phosphoraccumulans]|uniref:putative bifunctional diguanylate cyclase/phosphodiesterase n=1 Tax=Pengzhenrongella phosphoraccumulans TaxID=3114394 RepID=UPI003890830B
MRSSGHATYRTIVVWVMVALVAWYTGALALHGTEFSPLVDTGLGLATVWLPVAVCWLAVARGGLRRTEIVFAAAGVTSFAAGDTFYVASLAGMLSVPVPSPADVGYLTFYPLVLAALIVVVRRRARGMASSIWWDCVVGSLGAVSVLAVVLSPVVDSALAGSRFVATVIAVSYPLCDLLLVAAVAGIVTLPELRSGNRWGLLFAGLALFTATDVIFAMQTSLNTYEVGTPLDAGWAIGLAFIAFWVDAAARPVDPTASTQTRAAPRARALMVPALSTTAALVVLVMATREPLSALVVTLAGVTLLAAAVRTQIAFVQLAQMANLRRHEAVTDPLTGLPNRRALSEEAPVRLTDESRRHALMLLDLDKFKEVNDSLGHQAGDVLLIQVGARLREHLRAGDLLARLGGDEFAVLLEDSGHGEALAVAHALRAALAETFVVEGVALHSAASIGIALFPTDGTDLSGLLRKADIAMYRAKTSGDGHHFYGSEDRDDGAARRQTMDELRTAIESGELWLHYQPKIDLHDGVVRGVEALVRWRHPTRGLLFPETFLALVEEAGLMPAMTRVVLELAVDQAAAWWAQGDRLTVAINLSASSLVDADLPEMVAAMLAARELPSEALQLEITEEFLMANRDRARTILTRLRENGVQIAVDDFGTGYSSLAYLRDLPIDELKLDASFIRPMDEDRRAAALVASTVVLAHSLGLRMVAEGVETQASYDLLAQIGCDQAQGFLMSMPVPADAFDRWLDAHRTPAPSAEPTPQNSPAPLP